LSGVSLEISKITAEEKTPILQFVVAIHPDIIDQRYKNIRVCYNSQDEAKLLLDTIISRKPKNVAVLVSIDAVSTLEYDSYIKPKLEKAGIPISVEQTFNIGQSDFRVIVKRLAAVKPDMILLLGYGSDFATIMETIKSYKNLENTLIVGGIGFIEIPSYVDTRNYSNVVFTIPSILLQPKEQWNSDFAFFVQEYKKLDKNTIIPPYDAIYTYESIMLWAKTIREIENADPTSIIKHIHSLDEFEGISGHIRMNNGDSHPDVQLAKFSSVSLETRFISLKSKSN
jgi:ABC-type branched-subunit amino acid transport system substrate-binding protein